MQRYVLDRGAIVILRDEQTGQLRTGTCGHLEIAAVTLFRAGVEERLSDRVHRDARRRSLEM
jgi:hypothetical protein